MEEKNLTVIGSYSTREEALSVIERLRNEGYERDDIVIYTTDEAASRLGFDGLSGIDVETDENRMDGEEDRSLWEKKKDTFSFDTYDSETATPENDPLYQYRGDISDGKFVITVKGYRQPETTEDTMDTQDTVSPASTMGTGLETGTGTDPMDVGGTTGFQNTTDPLNMTPGTDPMDVPGETDTMGTSKTEDIDRKPNLDDDTIQLKEEKLDVNTHDVTTGEVDIHKHVVNDTETVEVPVKREEIVIERKPVTDQSSQGTDEKLEDDTITIPIKEEQVDVSKHTVIREEVGIHKEEHEDVEKVTEDVSREELDIDTIGNDGTLKVTKIGTAENEALNGAEFIISKEEGTPSVKKYIQSVTDGLYTWTTDQTKAKHFITGHSYDIGNNDFAEASIEKGQLIVNHLEVGKYNLEEVKAPDNAEMIEKQTITPFEILANSQTPVEKTIKNDTSKVDKTTPQLNGKDVAIGEKIQYEISVNIPLGIADKEGTQNKYTTFKLIDTHDAALTFDNDSSGTYAYALYDGNKEIDPVNYSVTEQTDGFTVSVDPNYIPSLTPGGTLKFVYYMHLNEKADPTKGFSNQANVDNGHTNDQTPPSVDVVTGGKRFVKVDGDVTSDQTLAGAEFVVRDQDSDTAKYLSIDPSTKAVSWVSAKESATVFTTTSNGLIDVTGLKYGTYYLEETKAPEKYVPLTNRVAFTIDEQSYVTAGQLISPEKIPNKHKGTLPSTGGKGIYVYIGAGVVLLLIAGLYFARRKHSQI